MLLLFFVVVMALTMWKDWWLTGEKPNILFYIFVPSISILGGVLGMFGVAKLCKQPPTFLEMLAIIIGVNTIMQVVEIVLKVIYYLVWEYPGLLYVVIVFLLGFLLGVYGLARWGRVKGWMAAVFMLVELVGEIVTAMLLTGLLGLTTPGS